VNISLNKKIKIGSRMKVTLLIIFGFFFISTCPDLVFSQQDTVAVLIHRIELKDGTILVGTILEEDENTISFRTNSQLQITIQKEHLKRKEIISGQIVKGEFWEDDPNATRMLIAPTARALKQGQGYFSIYEIFFPFVAVGITDVLSMAGGFSLFPGTSEQLLYLAPKFIPLQTKKFDLAAGVLYINIPDEGDAGIVYGVGTVIGEKGSFSVGMGYGFSGGEFASKPIIVLGGDIRVSKSIKLLTENWIITSETEVIPISFGIRFFGRRLAADFGLMHPLGEDTDGFPFLPWIGFAYNFGHRK
jgi:hypothetical protein